MAIDKALEQLKCRSSSQNIFTLYRCNCIVTMYRDCSSITLYETVVVVVVLVVVVLLLLMLLMLVLLMVFICQIRVRLQGSVRQTPMYNYIFDQYRAHQLTGAKYCKQQQELQHIGQTYLCLLQSSARQQVFVHASWFNIKLSTDVHGLIILKKGLVFGGWKFCCG